MRDRDNLFSAPPVMTGLETRDALQRLARRRLQISVVAGEDRPEQTSTVEGLGASGRYAIVLAHPAGAPPLAPAFGEGETLKLRWTEDAVGFAAQARVARVRAGDPPAYEIEVHPAVQRLGRRKTIRVRVEPADGIHAELFVDGQAAPLLPVVKDLSADGCRLSLGEAQARVAGLAPGLQSGLALRLPGAGEPQRARLEFLYAEPAGDGRIELGAAWLAPLPAFKDRIARFVAIKQVLLAQPARPGEADQPTDG